MPTARARPGRLYTPDPVNWRCPLNQGRAIWLLTLPHSSGGASWFDLAGRNTGTLTSMGNANNGWQPTTRPGGFGAILCDGTAGYVTGPVPSSLSVGTGDCTYAAWGKWTTSSVGFIFCTCSAGAQPGVDFLINQASGLNLSMRIGGTSSYIATIPNDGTWRRFLGSRSGGTITLYVNGVAVGSASATLVATASGSFQVGGRSGANVLFGGQCDSITAWPYGFSAAMAWMDYDQECRGYPDALNWS